MNKIKQLNKLAYYTSKKRGIPFRAAFDRVSKSFSDPLASIRSSEGSVYRLKLISHIESTGIMSRGEAFRLVCSSLWKTYPSSRAY